MRDSRDLQRRAPDHDLQLPYRSEENVFFSNVPAALFLAFNFDYAVYCSANHDSDAAVQRFAHTIQDPRFCLLALTDPVLSADEAVVAAATEGLRVHQRAIERLRKVLQVNEERWHALGAQLGRYEIKNDVGEWRYGPIVTADSPERQRQENAWQRESLSQIESHIAEYSNAISRDLDRIEARVSPQIERERRREAALDAGIAEFLCHRDARLIYRGRVHAFVGRNSRAWDYRFWQILANERAEIVLTQLQSSDDLKRRYDAAQPGDR